MRRRLPRPLLVAGSLIATALTALLLINANVRLELLGHLYADAASAPVAPAALVLGAEVYADGRPSPALMNRLDVAIELMRSGRVRTLLMSGGNGTFEVGAMRTYTIAHGVSPDAILLDASGERTIASCLQARDAFRMTRILVVSQELHDTRALRPRLRLVRGQPRALCEPLICRAADRKRPSSTGPEGRFRGGRTVPIP